MAFSQWALSRATHDKMFHACLEINVCCVCLSRDEMWFRWSCFQQKIPGAAPFQHWSRSCSRGCSTFKEISQQWKYKSALTFSHAVNINP